MIIPTINYLEQNKITPRSGQVLLAHQEPAQIVVYQAYKKEIADYAVANQKLGGSHFSLNRMSWIKPNFLWMMYRCGWAEKENQERVIAIWIRKVDFELILDNAVYSSYQEKVYPGREDWEKELNQKEVRLQWDPDHDPFGNKLERRAIQLGLKGRMLSTFCNEMIQKTEDITDFVKAQKKSFGNNNLGDLIVPVETAYLTTSNELNRKLGLG